MLYFIDKGWEFVYYYNGNVLQVFKYLTVDKKTSDL